MLPSRRPKISHSSATRDKESCKFRALWIRFVKTFFASPHSTTHSASLPPSRSDHRGTSDRCLSPTRCLLSKHTGRLSSRREESSDFPHGRGGRKNQGVAGKGHALVNEYSVTLQHRRVRGITLNEHYRTTDIVRHRLTNFHSLIQDMNPLQTTTIEGG